MSTYVILSRISPQAFDDPKDFKALAKDVSEKIKRECPGVTWKESFATLTYDGGSLSNVKGGSGLKLYIDSTTVRFVKDKTDVATFPASAITEISYGQDVHRRVGTAIGLGMLSFGVGAFMLLAKSKKHFVGLTWANGDHKGGLAMQCDKSDYRGILAALEGVSGKKAVNSETMTVKN